MDGRAREKRSPGIDQSLILGIEIDDDDKADEAEAAKDDATEEAAAAADEEAVADDADEEDDHSPIVMASSSSFSRPLPNNSCMTAATDTDLTEEEAADATARSRRRG